ncbi:MAG: hypothetical protein V4539_06620 [Bacteroidota bacterium]
MKQTWLYKVFSHPILQLISFSIIMIGGEIFASPYLWYVRYGSADGQAFGITGVVAMITTLISIVVKRFRVQLWGLILMWVSLIVFFCQSHNKAGLFEFPITEVTLSLFIAVSVCVVLKHVTWKNY